MARKPTRKVSQVEATPAEAQPNKFYTLTLKGSEIRAIRLAIHRGIGAANRRLSEIDYRGEGFEDRARCHDDLVELHSIQNVMDVLAERA